MKRKLELNSIIKMDELHWNDEEKKFVALSEKEIDQVCVRCYECGLEDIDSIMKVVRWAENIRIGNLLFKKLLKGTISVAVQEGSDEPYFAEKTVDSQ